MLNSLPSGIYNHNSGRLERGIFGPEPKVLGYFNSSLSANIGGDVEITNIFPIPTKKWQLGKVTRKQYEIVNLIWRKTKIFLDEESITKGNEIKVSKEVKRYSTPFTTYKNPEIFNRNRPTESNFQFYYLDRIDNIKERNRSISFDVEHMENEPQLFIHNYGRFDQHLTSPSFSAYAALQSNPQTTSTVKPIELSRSLRGSFQRLNFEQTTNKLKIKRPSNEDNEISDYSRGETCPLFTTQINTQPSSFSQLPSQFSDITTTTLKSLKAFTKNIVPSVNLLTTIYDKIKFFEMYDRQTENNGKVFNNYDDMNNVEKNKMNIKQTLGPNNLTNDQKILLDHIDRDIGHHDGIHNKFAKKHISNDEYVHMNISSTTYSYIPPAFDDYFAQLTNVKNFSSFTRRDEIIKRATYADLSKLASWTDYPFAAVYVYEPSQVLCDAAVISDHWLITAGSCLSRQHRLDLTSDGRSAFVTYCGVNWRRPERIAYVKYTRVHPKFNPRIRARRFLYNIGVIKVINSLLLACPGLQPISFMSYHYATGIENSVASAVGWGLDRYAAKLDSEIPTHPLMVYNERMNSYDCPGSIGYKEAQEVEPLNAVRNIYCLTLPPYKNEENDPVHGSLLLIGGKLIALYLQEERRDWGEQSAQYTGVYRLIPWILEVAQEPEDIDSFTENI